MSALEAALNATWAMEPAALERLLAIAARENEVTPEALEAYRAKALENSAQATIRDGVAIITANGPMFRRANLFTALSGATSYDIMRGDLQAAVDKGAKAILLNIDSPGGEVNGGNELAQAVADLRGKVPIVAYVGGMAASMGYWLASAADKIIIDPTSILGSIGAQVAYIEREAPKGETRYRLVSSVSPLKNAEGDAGAKQMQAVVDALGQVFVETVARNRGVATETVLNDFGKGGIFVGQAAIDAGMADGFGTFESVLAELSAGKGGRKSASKPGARMSDENTFTAEQRDAAVADARASEKARVANLTKLATAHGAPSADLTAAIDGDKTVEAFALELADKAAAKADADKAAAAAADAGKEEVKRAALAALKTDEEAAAAAAASTGSEPEAKDSVEAVAAAIIAA